jgi:Na+-translocating ferredoxin:NAD+ oxidoreductase subunit B
VNRSPQKSQTLSDVIKRIDAVLPQTQCTRCGYPACLPYAEAIAQGQANINQCPPGGDAGIHLLASITGKAYQPLDPAFGIEAPRRLALIDEARCIGCTLCIAACPVDAIVGGNKCMHTVIAQDCTGCELCVAPCPVDCIDMVKPAAPLAWSAADQARAREQFYARKARLTWQQTTAVNQNATKGSLQEILARAKDQAAKTVKAVKASGV